MPGVTQVQLDGLGSRFDKGLDEIKNMIRSFEERVRAVEQREAGCYPLVAARLEAAEKEIAAQKDKIEKLDGLIQKQIMAAESMSKDIQTIINWGKWGARIVTALVISGLAFLLGRMIYLSVVHP